MLTFLHNFEMTKIKDELEIHVSKAVAKKKLNMKNG